MEDAPTTHQPSQETVDTWKNRTGGENNKKTHKYKNHGGVHKVRLIPLKVRSSEVTGFDLQQSHQWADGKGKSFKKKKTYSEAWLTTLA